MSSTQPWPASMNSRFVGIDAARAAAKSALGEPVERLRRPVPVRVGHVRRHDHHTVA
jgi:hypothetical protein